MKRYVLMTLCLLAVMITKAQQVITVKKGDAKSLLEAVEQANKQNKEKDAKRLYILIPDGFYNLGETVLTRITGHNIALIGESMAGTVIQNKPDVKKEGIVARVENGVLTVELPKMVEEKVKVSRQIEIG